MDRASFIAKYPDYHRDCDGWGVFKNLSAPGGYFRECSCLRDKRCPRCNSDVDQSLHCPGCEWDLADKDRGIDSPMAG